MQLRVGLRQLCQTLSLSKPRTKQVRFNINSESVKTLRENTYQKWPDSRVVERTDTGNVDW